MIKKLTLLTVFGAGYVLGAKAGRERYEAIHSMAGQFLGKPPVKHATERLQHTAEDLAGKAMETVKATVTKTVDLTEQIDATPGQT